MNPKRFLAICLSFVMMTGLLSVVFPSATVSAEEEKTVKLRGNVDLSESDPIPSDGEPDAEQFYNTYLDSQPTTLDPAKCADAYGIDVIFNTLEPLIRIGEDENGLATPFAAAAESWEISEDQLSYTFHLRDLLWSDDKPLTSADFAFAFRRGATPATACPYASWFYPILNGKAVVAGEMEPSELGVETPDDKTFVVKLEKPLPYFLQQMALRNFYPQREDLVEKYGDSYATTPETSPACGPFILDNWTINSELNYVKNEKYWNADAVKLQKISVKIIQDTNAVYNALESGLLDGASVRDAKRRAAFSDDDRFYHLKSINPGTSFMMGNNKEGQMTANAKIRRAISVALDRQEMIDSTMDGVPVPAFEFVPPQINIGGAVFNVPGEGPVDKLIAEVEDPRALFLEGMAELGLGDDPASVTMKMVGTGDSQDVRLMAEFIQQNLEEVLGCKVEVDISDWNTFFQKAKNGEFDLAWLSYGAQYNDPADFLELWWSEAAIFDLGWKNEAYDKAISAAQQESDNEKRAQLFHEAETILCREDALIMPLTHGVSHSFTRSYMRGVSTNFFNSMGYQNYYCSGRED